MSYFNEDQQDYMKSIFSIPREKRCQCGWYLKDECSNTHCCEDARRIRANTPLNGDHSKRGSLEWRDPSNQASDGDLLNY